MPLTQHDLTRLEQIDDDIENERTTEYSQADMIWMRCLLQDALDELATRTMTKRQWREQKEKRLAMSQRGQPPLTRWNPPAGMLRGECPYCGKESNLAILKRWHFDKCPQKPKWV